MSDTNEPNRAVSVSQGTACGNPPPNLEMLTMVLAGAQEQIRFADSKAGFVALFHTILFGFISSQAERLSEIPADHRHVLYWFMLIGVISYGIATISAVTFAIVCVIPRLGERVPGRRLHFWHISEGFGDNSNRYCQEVLQMDDQSWANELGTQIVAVSRIARIKHDYVSRAARITIAAVILWGGTLTMSLFF